MCGVEMIKNVISPTLQKHTESSVLVFINPARHMHLLSMRDATTKPVFFLWIFNGRLAGALTQ